MPGDGDDEEGKTSPILEAKVAKFNTIRGLKSSYTRKSNMAKAIVDNARAAVDDHTAGNNDLVLLKEEAAVLKQRIDKYEAAADAFREEYGVKYPIDSQTVADSLEESFDNYALRLTEINDVIRMIEDDEDEDDDDENAGGGPNAPAQPRQPVGLNTKLFNELKPDNLLGNQRYVDFLSWRDSLVLWMSKTKIDQEDLETQQGFFLSCMELGLQTSVKTKITDATGVLKPAPGSDECCMTILEDVFLRKEPLINRRIEAFTCRQRVGEKFSAWQTRCDQSWRLAQGNNITPEDIRHLLYLVNSCDQDLVRDYLRDVTTGGSLQEFEEMALHYEGATTIYKKGLKDQVRLAAANAGKSQHKGPGKSGNKSSGGNFGNKSSANPPNSSGAKKGDTSKINKKPKCKRCGRDLHEKKEDCPALNDKCRKCGKVGHWIAGCFDKDKSGSNNKAKINAIQVKLRSDSSLDDQILLDARVLKTKQWHSFKAVPDTGCTHTIIPERLVRSAVKKGLFDATDVVEIEAVNGSTLSCLGSIRMQLRYEGVLTCIKGFITSDLNDVMYISCDDLKAMRVIPACFPRVTRVRGVTSIKDGATKEEAREQLVKTIKDGAMAQGKEDTDQLDQAIRDAVEGVIMDFPSVFNDDELKPMTGEPMKIHLKDDKIKPINLANARNVPIAYRMAARKAIEDLVKCGIIEEVSWPTAWTSPCVFVPKSDGTVRPTTDFKVLNMGVQRPVHPFPTPHDISITIPNETKLFCVLDAKQGYHQIVLDEKSRDLTTFITPWGRFRYKRAPMGLSSSGDEFCRRGDQALHGLEGVHKLVDDVLVTGVDEQQLKDRLRQVLERCEKAGITLSKKKLQVGSSVKYAGMIVSDKGVLPDPDKVRAIRDFPKPTNITEMRSFAGICNQLGKFAPDLAHAMEPLRGLLSPKNTFQWLPDVHGPAFDKVKSILCDVNGPILHYFDPALETKLYTDASSLKGIGFALLQQHPDEDNPRLIQANSRALIDAENRYAVCELEAEAIQWGIKKCRLHLAGINFNVVTDHKPLVNIFNRSNIEMTDNRRLQRNLEKTAGYQFWVEWVPGKRQLIADALSRSPVFGFDPDDVAEKVAEHLDEATPYQVCRIQALQVHPDLAFDNLTEMAMLDKEYQRVRRALQDAKEPKNLSPTHPAKLYNSVWTKMSYDDVLMYVDGTRVVVPRELRQRILEQLHTPHLGQTKTRYLAKSLYYWPGLNNDIANVTASCSLCAERLASLAKEPLIQTTASRPMEHVSVDWCHHNGKNFLIMVDRYCGYPWVAESKNCDTPSTIRILDRWFCDHGFPNALRSDGGPCFKSDDFGDYCRSVNILHEMSSSDHHESNGLAERTVRSMKDLLAKVKPSEFRRGLLHWRNVPRYDGLSPAQWMFGRRQRTLLPASEEAYFLINQSVISDAEEAKENYNTLVRLRFGGQELPQLPKGARVLVQDRRPHARGRWKAYGRVLRLLKGRSRTYLVQVRGRILKRNRRFLRLDLGPGDQADDESMADDQRQPDQGQPVELRRSTRLADKERRRFAERSTSLSSPE